MYVSEEAGKRILVSTPVFGRIPGLFIYFYTFHVSLTITMISDVIYIVYTINFCLYFKSVSYFC